MTLLIDAAKMIGGPGSIGFFVFWSVLVLVMGRLGWRRVSRALLASLIAVYLILSLPPVAHRLAESLTGYQPLTDLTPLTGVRTILVLDGDNRRGRVGEAKRLFDVLHPDQVVVSGQTWIVDAIAEIGIPKDRIAHESESRNTREQIDLIRKWPPRSVVIVASRFQMPRIVAFLGSAASDVYLAPSPADIEISTLSSIQWVIPRYSALRISRDALYELAALYYYRRSGGIEDIERPIAHARAVRTKHSPDGS
jgi:uncharacterized SAM-binding protein YcdF (DUF218 family)